MTNLTSSETETKLPLGVAANGSAADNGVVARLIERIAIVGIQIKADGCKGVRERLRLLPALAVHPSEVAKSERCWFGGGMFVSVDTRAARRGS